jgi:hypothetical protein
LLISVPFLIDGYGVGKSAGAAVLGEGEEAFCTCITGTNIPHSLIENLELDLHGIHLAMLG